MTNNNIYLKGTHDTGVVVSTTTKPAANATNGGLRDELRWVMQDPTQPIERAVELVIEIDSGTTGALGQLLGFEESPELIDAIKKDDTDDKQTDPVEITNIVQKEQHKYKRVSKLSAKDMSIAVVRYFVELACNAHPGILKALLSKGTKTIHFRPVSESVGLYWQQMADTNNSELLKWANIDELRKLRITDAPKAKLIPEPEDSGLEGQDPEKRKEVTPEKQSSKQNDQGGGGGGGGSGDQGSEETFDQGEGFDIGEETTASVNREQSGKTQGDEQDALAGSSDTPEGLEDKTTDAVKDSKPDKYDIEDQPNDAPVPLRWSAYNKLFPEFTDVFDYAESILNGNTAKRLGHNVYGKVVRDYDNSIAHGYSVCTDVEHHNRIKQVAQSVKDKLEGEYKQAKRLMDQFGTVDYFVKVDSNTFTITIDGFATVVDLTGWRIMDRQRATSALVADEGTYQRQIQL